MLGSVDYRCLTWVQHDHCERRHRYSNTGGKSFEQWIAHYQNNRYQSLMEILDCQKLIRWFVHLFPDNVLFLNILNNIDV